MSDTVYRVRVNYTVDTGNAERGVSSLSSGFGGLKNIIMGAAAAFGVSRFAEKIFEIGSKAEDTRIALAGMMQAGGAAGLGQGADDFTKSMGMSQEIMKQMRKDARELPGEFEDLVNVFRGGLAGGIASGKSINEIEHLSATMMATSKMLGIESDTAGREFAMMMEGRAGAHNTLFQRLHNQIGKTGQEFNALTQPQKWALIEKALKGYEPAVKEFGNTWSAVESSTEDFAKQVFRVGTAPVFEMVKRHLNEWNDWFVKNQKMVEDFAVTWGGKLADGIEKAFDVAKDVFGYIVQHKDTLIAIAEAYAAIRIGSIVGGIATSAIGGAASAASAIGIGGGAAVAGGVGIAATIATVVSVLAASGAVGILIGAYFDNKTKPEAERKRREDQFTDFTTKMYSQAEDANKMSNKLHDSNLMLYRTTVHGYGPGKDGSQGILADVVSRQKKSIDETTAMTIRWLRDSNALVTAGKGTGSRITLDENAVRIAARAGGGNEFAEERALSAARLVMKSTTILPSVDDLAKSKLDEKGKIPQHVNITNNNHIVQTIENANDPQRVLIKTREALDSIYRHETVSPNNRIATLR